MLILYRNNITMIGSYAIDWFLRIFRSVVFVVLCVAYLSKPQELFWAFETRTSIILKKTVFS